MSNLCRGPLLLAMLAAAPPLSAATPPATPRDGVDVLAPPKALSIDPAADRLVAQGGELSIRWNDELLRDLGMPRRGAAPGPDATLRVPLSKASRLEADVRGRSLRPFAAGGGQLQGAFQFDLRDGTRIAWRQPTFVVRPGENLRFDFASDDGQVLFYGDHLMYGLSADGAEVQLRSFDLRIAPALAERLGQPKLVGLAVAEVRGHLPVVSRIGAAVPKACGDPNWPGEPVAGVPGAVYQADVFTTGFSAQFSRCRATPSGGTCDGPGGATDGEIVFTPSSTLRNNVNQGAPVAVVPGDPLGTSSALYSADVEWETKFTNNVAGPYPQNDQHPFLIWNLYRIDADGAITQVGRSGVKHAWLTINVGSGCESCNGGHVLGRACSDTYGTGNNDNPSDLGPRREIIPATGQWGRCRSIYDTNCDGVQNAGGNGNYDQRMRVPESAVDAAANPGASWLFESWYIVRDDINIHNTIGTQPFTASWTGSVWQVTNGTPYRLGSAVSRWVAAAPAGSVARLDPLDAPEGEAQLGLRVTDLGGGNYRYEYAFMNLDFARAATAGAEPNLEVLRNHGFKGFLLPLAPGATATDVVVADGDQDAANDWVVTQAGGQLAVRAPDAASSLNWGSMLRIGFTVAAPPVPTTATLEVTEPGTPASYPLATLGPDLADRMFGDGFE
jgi:hypothetical protein